MYPLGGFHSNAIGDVDVLEVDGRFHLVHLVIPTHDLIAFGGYLELSIDGEVLLSLADDAVRGYRLRDGG